MPDFNVFVRETLTVTTHPGQLARSAGTAATGAMPLRSMDRCPRTAATWSRVQRQRPRRQRRQRRARHLHPRPADERDHTGQSPQCPVRQRPGQRQLVQRRHLRGQPIRGLRVDPDDLSTIDGTRSSTSAYATCRRSLRLASRRSAGGLSGGDGGNGDSRDPTPSAEGATSRSTPRPTTSATRTRTPWSMSSCATSSGREHAGQPPERRGPPRTATPRMPWSPPTGV